MSSRKPSKTNRSRIARISGRYFRLVIPNLREFGTFWSYQDRAIQDLKNSITKKLYALEFPRGLEQYLVAVERHETTGFPHVDIMLVYRKRVKNSFTRFDYLLKHGDLTKYKKLTSAILDYSRKQDPNPVGNLNTEKTIMDFKSATRDGLYDILESAMTKDPFNFNCEDYIFENNLGRNVLKTNWQSVIKRIGLQQNSLCNYILRKKPGIRLITRDLIEKKLSKSELKLYDSWRGYQKIINLINEISKYGWSRPHKSLNLLLVGPPNTGKTSLIMELEKHTSSYPLGTKKGWFPAFKNRTYKLLVWDEFSLGVYKYPDLLKLLEGRPMQLPIKGGHISKDDRQLMIATSNISLIRHVKNRFYKQDDVRDSIANLRARIIEIKVSKITPLFILIKLIEKQTIQIN